MSTLAIVIAVAGFFCWASCKVANVVSGSRVKVYLVIQTGRSQKAGLLQGEVKSCSIKPTLYLCMFVGSCRCSLRHHRNPCRYHQLLVCCRTSWSRVAAPSVRETTYLGPFPWAPKVWAPKVLTRLYHDCFHEYRIDVPHGFCAISGYGSRKHTRPLSSAPPLYLSLA